MATPLIQLASSAESLRRFIGLEPETMNAAIERARGFVPALVVHKYAAGALGK
jgi:hypothetical protein